MVMSPWCYSKFYVVHQIVYNNVYIKFKTMYYTILSSLYLSRPPGIQIWIYIDQFFENNFCPVKERPQFVNILFIVRRVHAFIQR